MPTNAPRDPLAAASAGMHSTRSPIGSVGSSLPPGWRRSHLIAARGAIVARSEFRVAGRAPSRRACQKCAPPYLYVRIEFVATVTGPLAGFLASTSRMRVVRLARLVSRCGIGDVH